MSSSDLLPLGNQTLIIHQSKIIGSALQLFLVSPYYPECSQVGLKLPFGSKRLGDFTKLMFGLELGILSSNQAKSLIGKIVECHIGMAKGEKAEKYRNITKVFRELDSLPDPVGETSPPCITAQLSVNDCQTGAKGVL